MCNRLVNDEITGHYSGITEQDFMLHAKVDTITKEIFDFGRPLYGREESLKLRFRWTVYDETKYLKNITIWHTAAQEIFQITVEQILNMWSKCKTDEGQETFLRTLNANTHDKTYAMYCTGKLWRYVTGETGKLGRYVTDNDKMHYQINVNNAEILYD